MLLVLADGSKFPPHVILNHKKCLRSNCIEYLLSDSNVNLGGRIGFGWCVTEGQGMPVFYAF